MLPWGLSPDTLGKMDFRVRETNSVSLSKVKVKKNQANNMLYKITTIASTTQELSVQYPQQLTKTTDDPNCQFIKLTIKIDILAECCVNIERNTII